ncbi:uncharacterized protein LOC113857777 [Abrus precatorius]|uniref:Uncharacterized protein LOC113857777 n=1 Tax=Abrus precatorius TaxID=3816 RepID=A0A8B8KPI9_ABRPR|nr:uncharacterized protein LOC113857777 [Abrus precatorius]
MGFNDKYNNADGKDPDFGAIFMSNTETKRECLRMGLFGLPSTEIQFVEQVKAGMILFLFEYENRQLHGVFKASCDGGINIVPNAFTSLRRQCPAQVKFVPIWFCKPLPEKVFRDAIRGNYFSANKFNFGLSESQVHKLLYLFSTRKLELEVPERSLTRTEDLKSKWYPQGKVGRSVDHGMHVESVQNEQIVGDNISPTIMHKCQGDSLQYNGDVEYFGLNAGDIIVNKQGRAAQLAVDATNGYVRDYLALKDESGFTAHENEDYMDACHRPNIIGGYSKSPSDKVRVYSDGWLSISDRFMNEDLRKNDPRMVFSDDIPGLHNSDVNQSVFHSKPNLEHNSLIQNQLRPTSTMIHPVQAQILNNSCAAQGDASSKSTALLYDPDVPGLNFSRPSSVGINEGANSIMESISPSNNFRRSSLSSQPCLIHPELKDMNRWHNDGGGFQDSVLYSSSNRDCMPLSAAQNSDQLGTESVIYEARNIPSLKYSSCHIPPSDIGNSTRIHEPFSSLFHNHQSSLGNSVHLTTLQENLSHEITLQRNNEIYTRDVPWTNEGQSLDGNPVIHEYDIGCYGDSKNNNFGHPKKKSSVFSRLSFMQDINKPKSGNSVRNDKYDFYTSVDEVMERIRQRHNQWMKKRKPKPKHNKAESLRDKTQSISSRMKSDCSEDTLTDHGMDLTTERGGNTNKTAEKLCFVDFKRRSKVRKLSDENEIKSTNESQKSENFMVVQPKRRKLIRPNFSNSTTSQKGIDLGASQLQVPSSHGTYNVKDVSESCCALVQTKEDNIKADAEAQNIIDQTHSQDKNSSHATGCACSVGGKRATDGALTAFNDRSNCLENINNQNVFSSASCKDKSCHIKKGFCTMDNIKSVSADTKSSHSICQEHHVDKITCAGRDINAEEEMPQDCSSTFSNEVKDTSEYLQNSANEKAPTETYCPIKEGLPVMNDRKSVSTGTNSLHSICQEHHIGKIICAGKGSNTEEMSKDGGSFVSEVKDGFHCIQNSANENASIATSCFKEGLCMIDSTKSGSLGAESLHSICQESRVHKVIFAGRAIKTEEGMSKDGGSSFTSEVKDGLKSSQNSGNDNAPIATCEDKMA